MMKLLLLFTLFLVVSCTSIQLIEKWSPDIPPKSYFIGYYKQDAAHTKILGQHDYLIWVQRFYFGWELYQTGWLQGTNKLSRSLTSSEQQKLAREKSLLLGKLIAAEWAKNKDYRVINTRHLSIWGNVLNESIVKKEQLVMLDKILADVNALLDKRITPNRISYNLYYDAQAFGGNFN